MTKLSGAAADARLAEAWESIFNEDPATQEIIHVLAPPVEYPAWVTDFPPFRAWTQNGGAAGDEVWQAFAGIASSWPYIQNARRAATLGIPNVRIFVLKRAAWESPPPWLQYLVEVHLPAIAALAGETHYRVWQEDCRESGLPVRDYDVNLWGAGRVMLAGYQDGDVDWRAFLTEDRDPGRYREERGFVVAMREFASGHGELVELPAELQP